MTLAAGENNNIIDAGLVDLASLGDTVWLDLNGDGIQNKDEPGVDGVTVKLLDANGNVVDMRTTANGGTYEFTGLIPGTYVVEFLAPTGREWTSQNVGDDSLDSDADPTSGRTGSITLAIGEITMRLMPVCYRLSE